MHEIDGSPEASGEASIPSLGSGDTRRRQQIDQISHVLVVRAFKDDLVPCVAFKDLSPIGRVTSLFLLCTNTTTSDHNQKIESRQVPLL